MFNLLEKKSVGLDISDYSIEVVSLGGSIKNPRLLSLGRITLEEGIVENGKILNKEKLEKHLKGLIKNPKFGELKTRKIIFSLPESRSFIQIFKIPSDLKKEGEEEEIKSQIAQTIPYPLEALYFDYKIKEGINFKEILLGAVPKKIVNDYLEIFKSCQLQSVILEIESESLARSLIDKKQKPVLIADIGARTTNFSVFDENGLRLSVSTPIAGNKFTRVLAEKLKISKEEAENLKIKIGLNAKLKKGRIFLILQKEIYNIIKEINKVFNYFQKKEQKEITKIILIGGSANLPCLKDYLSQNLEKEVVIGDPWVKINIDILRKKEYFKKALEISPILYSTVIGSALRGLIKKPEEAGLNLLPKGRKL